MAFQFKKQFITTSIQINGKNIMTFRFYHRPGAQQPAQQFSPFTEKHV
jgi:hypothetical protein